MKKSYVSAELEILTFFASDIITSSGDGWLSGDGKPNYDNDGWT